MRNISDRALRRIQYFNHLICLYTFSYFLKQVKYTIVTSPRKSNSSTGMTKQNSAILDSQCPMSILISSQKGMKEKVSLLFLFSFQDRAAGGAQVRPWTNKHKRPSLSRSRAWPDLATPTPHYTHDK